MIPIIEDSTPTETKAVLDDAEMIKELSALLAVEYDLISAYQAVMQRLETESFMPALEQIVSVHQSHIEQLTTLITKLGGQVETTGDFKEFLAKRYVALSALFGDYRLLSAMRHNLQLATQQYANAHKKVFSGAIQLVLKQQLGQTRRHVVLFEKWLETLDKDA